MGDLNPYHILLKEQDFDCNVEFDVQGELMGGHSDIIEPSSSVLAAMMHSDKIIIIEDVEPEVFSQILYFIYSGKIILNSEVFCVCDEDGMLQRILKANEKYNVKNLKGECIKMINTGVFGRTIPIFVNHFAVTMKKRTIFHYDVDVKPVPPKTFFKYIFVMVMSVLKMLTSFILNLTEKLLLSFCRATHISVTLSLYLILRISTLLVGFWVWIQR